MENILNNASLYNKFVVMNGFKEDKFNESASAYVTFVRFKNIIHNVQFTPTRLINQDIQNKLSDMVDSWSLNKMQKVLTENNDFANMPPELIKRTIITNHRKRGADQ